MGIKLNSLYIERKKWTSHRFYKKIFIPVVGSTSVEIDISGEDMKIGEMLNKQVEYWYEIELNNDETIIGYDDEGAKKINSLS